MPEIPDLTNARYRDEIGWFLYHERYGREIFGGSYDEERIAYSHLLLDKVLRFIQRDLRWLSDKTVLSVGCGCTGDLVAFPAAMKICIDPLLYTYQKLDMLMADQVGGRTFYLSMGAENLPLLDDFADLVICRNALDHMHEPERALTEFRRTLKNDGVLFASVDIGGEPTHDEPTVFSVESLRVALEKHFEILTFVDDFRPHSAGRVCKTIAVARKKPGPDQRLDRDAILRAYRNHLPDATNVAG
jgi:SAM-dependent methyltransferase